MVNCGGQCCGMNDQELNFWISSSVIFSILLLSPGEIQTWQATEHSTIQNHLYKNLSTECGEFFVPHQNVSSSSLPPWHEETCPQRVDEWPVKSSRCAEFHPEIPPVDLLSSSDLPAELLLQVTAPTQGAPSCEEPAGSCEAASLECQNLSDRSQDTKSLRVERTSKMIQSMPSPPLNYVPKCVLIFLGKSLLHRAPALATVFAKHKVHTKMVTVPEAFLQDCPCSGLCRVLYHSNLYLHHA